jgi:hypothetical protein
LRYRDVLVGSIILILSLAGYLGYDFFQKEKIVVIYNQNNNSANPTPDASTFYDLSIETEKGPIKINLTPINSKEDIYEINVTQNITFFKGFNDPVIIRNILLSGNIEYGIYDKNTRLKRYSVDSNYIPFEKSYINETGDIFIKTLGTSHVEKSFSVRVDISKLREMAQNNNFTNTLFIIDYYPQLSLDVHIVDKNVKQKLSSDVVYYFYIDLDKVFGT